MLEFGFWASSGLMLYTYAGYFLLVRLLARLSSKKTTTQEGYLPHISLLISAYNEEDVIGQKLTNCRELDYPGDRVEILFGLDGSTDATESILKAENCGLVKLHSFKKRRGKPAVLNDLVKQARGEVLVFSDANTMFEPSALKNLTRHFVDCKIGGVCGELVLHGSSGDGIGSNGEKLYWDYEKKLKFAEGHIKSVLGANGAIYAIRRDLYEDVPEQKMVVDDFLIPLRVVEKGFRVIYDAEAIGSEFTSSSMRDEFSRKVRIGIGNFNALNEIVNLLNPKRGFIALALWSHKIIRWFVPFLAVIALLTNIGLLGQPIYNLTFLLQAVFYVCVGLGAVSNALGFAKNIFAILFYFFMVNLALLVGFFRFLFRPQKASWTPSARSVL